MIEVGDYHIKLYKNNQLTANYQYKIEICDVDVYNGKLAVAFKYNARLIYIYDIETGEKEEIFTPCRVFDVELSKDYLFYCDDDQWCYVYAYHLTDGQTKYVEFPSGGTNNFYYPSLEVNNDQNILYVTSSFTPYLTYVSIDTWSVKTGDASTSYNEPVYYNGKTVYCGGDTFDAIEPTILKFNSTYDTSIGVGWNSIVTYVMTDKYSFTATQSGSLVISYKEISFAKWIDNIHADGVTKISEDKFFITRANDVYIIDMTQFE